MISRMSFNEDIEMYSPRRPMKTFSPKRANSTPLLSIARENNAENNFSHVGSASASKNYFTN